MPGKTIQKSRTAWMISVSFQVIVTKERRHGSDSGPKKAAPPARRRSRSLGIAHAQRLNRDVDERDEFLQRAAQRSAWPVRRYALGQEPSDSSSPISASERIAMMWPLALEAWKIARLPIPDYTRRNLPFRIVRGPTE